MEIPVDTSGVTANEILRQGVAHMEERAKTYDNGKGERSIGKTVAAFNAITGHNLTEEEGWMFMVTLKMVRTQQGAFKQDSYEDGAAYCALMGEAAAKERR